MLIHIYIGGFSFLWSFSFTDPLSSWSCGVFLPYCEVNVLMGGVQTLTLATELFMVTPGAIDKSKGDSYGLKVGVKMQKGICSMHKVALMEESYSFYFCIACIESAVQAATVKHYPEG